MNTKYIFLISVVIFVILLFVIPGSFIPAELGNTILTVVAFLFGIIAGFYIIVTTTDYNNVKNILAIETANWISLHQNILIYDKQIADKLASLIDKYILRTFDFEILDHTKSTHNEFESIKKLMRELPLKENLSSVYEKIQNIMSDIIISRQQLTVLGARTLSIFQWTILFALASIFIFSLYGLRTGELFFDVVTIAISSSIVLVLLLIRDLDLYIWNEKTFGYDIFENVLKSIGQLPYYPAESIKKKRVQPHDKEYRVGTYINFPKSTDRKIEIQKSIC
ncbi:MAG: hypothetical protein C0412_17060 [Flavobacterium sp.]|nr:hypothetical protein [Flavobacterium sp.]